MKIVIEHSKTKRCINGDFNLCGSRSDLLALAKQIEAATKEESFTYGWISVVTSKQESIKDTPAMAWDVAAPNS